MTQTIFQTATPTPVVDFSPTKQYPSFSGLINQTLTVSALTAGQSNTITYAQVLGGIINHNTSSSAYTDTLPTAALLVPEIEGVEVGTTIRFLIRNTSAGAGTITVAVGTGGTSKGNTLTIPYLTQMEFLLVVTAVGATPTYDLYPMGNQTF